ncbi:MAG TPA: c-type cytochrome biogenesis protein CcmI [Usitatibacter sp.]|nr:c-type cytochrome biogenesis protein CcmI [Usitatibacter sp.]
MASFWILAALMTVAALAFVLVPLLRGRPGAGISVRDSNLEVLRAQRREIDADVASGTLAPEARDEALAELMARASDDLETSPGEEPASIARPWIVAGATALAMTALAFGMYAAVGTPVATDVKALAKAADAHDDARIAEMVDALARKMRERPDDAGGWSLLARSYASLGRFKDAAEAYEHLAKLAPDDPDVLADYADMLGMAQGRTLAGKPAELARAALKLDPDHRKALALAGTAALDAGDYAAARAHWQRLAERIPAESPERAQVLAVIDEVQQRAAAAGKPLAPAPVARAPKAPEKLAKAPEKAPKAAGAASISGSVSLAPGMAGQVNGSETLFIFARAEGGARIPLAVLRKTARELPLQFALDDTLAMTPELNISTAQAVRIEARISKSGDALPRSGDLIGASSVVQPGARDVKIVVDKVVP